MQRDHITKALWIHCEVLFSLKNNSGCKARPGSIRLQKVSLAVHAGCSTTWVPQSVTAKKIAQPPLHTHVCTRSHQVSPKCFSVTEQHACSVALHSFQFTWRYTVSFV